MDFEQIFNIHEGTSNVQYEPHQADHMLSTLSAMVGTGLNK